MNSKLDEESYEEKQLEEFSKFNLSEKLEKIYSWLEFNETVDASTGPEGARLFLKENIEYFIKNPEISQKIKNEGLYCSATITLAA